MNRISFYGSGAESAGSIADRQTITAKQESAGGIADNDSITAKQETAGGIAARVNQQSRLGSDVKLRSLDHDTVSFQGREVAAQKGTSALGVIAGLAFSAAAVIGTLGCAKKFGWIEKLGEGKFKDFVTKIAEPCHKWCAKTKEYTYDKVADWFSKKKA